jgi:redox-sensitive bicupin YhaK (pirin superfamily)
MITIYPHPQLGHVNHGWLDARHHFSFGMYHNPGRTGFGDLLVINDDKVAAGRGFAPHPHDNMEIITYVRTGAITHEDSMGNIGRTEAGDVQVMSAGTGIKHSEMNRESVDTTLFQIWIEPNQQNVKPRWEAKQFPKEPVSNQLGVLASGRTEHAKSGALFIHTDAAIYGGMMKAESSIVQPITYQAYILASKGEMEIDGVRIAEGDGAEITGSTSITIRAITDSEVLVIDVPNSNHN